MFSIPLLVRKGKWVGLGIIKGGYRGPRLVEEIFLLGARRKY